MRFSTRLYNQVDNELSTMMLQQSADSFSKCQLKFSFTIIRDFNHPSCSILTLIPDRLIFSNRKEKLVA